MKKKLIFIGLVSCILVLLLGATMVSAAPSEIIVTAGEGADVTYDINVDSNHPIRVTIYNDVFDYGQKNIPIPPKLSPHI